MAVIAGSAKIVICSLVFKLTIARRSSSLSRSIISLFEIDEKIVRISWVLKMVKPVYFLLLRSSSIVATKFL